MGSPAVFPLLQGIAKVNSVRYFKDNEYYLVFRHEYKEYFRREALNARNITKVPFRAA